MFVVRHKAHREKQAAVEDINAPNSPKNVFELINRNLLVESAHFEIDEIFVEKSLSVVINTVRKLNQEKQIKKELKKMNSVDQSLNLISIDVV